MGSKAAVRKAHHDERRGWVNAYKLQRGCSVCGYNKHPAALEFNHRDPETKEFNIGSDGLKLAWPRLLAEIEKCDVVCANCHREITY